ncbi:hypothetical protein AB833_11610 [Chromatiales bacterium (ex Bugula neritina AB1)]|nr:hypothetical protein AB833_11610 [Chromatiales bacterium (ex Bugula neritina AB1)]
MLPAGVAVTVQLLWLFLCWFSVRILVAVVAESEAVCFMVTLFHDYKNTTSNVLIHPAHEAPLVLLNSSLL